MQTGVNVLDVVSYSSNKWNQGKELSYENNYPETLYKNIMKETWP